MANHPSADKRNRQRVTRTARNRSIKSAVRTKVKLARTGAPGAPETQAKVIEAYSALDRAATKGAIHPKAAARKKARLARAVHKATLAAKA